jgi:hypothetical protein
LRAYRVSAPENCPRCNESPVLGGYVNGFCPGFAWTRGTTVGAAITVEARTCLSCGLVWSFMEPSRLHRFLRDCTGELGRQYLDELERGRYRDLPDTDLAREIGDHIADLDAVARDSSAGKVVRRYRELRGVTWDQALRDGTKWAELSRPEKLALFGWIPKKAKEPFDDLL